MRFDNKVVLVTGGASGIGLAVCQEFAKAGARVILTDVNSEQGMAAAQAIEAECPPIRFLKLDVTSPDSISAAIESVTAGFGRLDILVNAAGWDVIEPFMENTPEYWDKIVALNFMGPIQVTRAALPLLFETDGARIVNVGSDAGRVGSLGETVYAGAKGGTIAFTKSLAREVVSRGVTVNCVCPGPTDTPLFATHSEKIRNALTRAIPMKRLAQPKEIADAVLFFASDRANYVTGQVLSVSGGLTMVD
jgi:2-hydroxycyclohexanecarboxyl-CoA dehydrogenase